MHPQISVLEYQYKNQKWMFFWKVLLILGTKLCEIVYLPTAVLYFKELKNVTKRYPQQLGEPKNLRHKRSQAIFTCASDRLFLAIKIKEVQYQYLEPYIWAILRKNNKGLPLCIVLGHEVHGVVGALHILSIQYTTDCCCQYIPCSKQNTL